MYSGKSDKVIVMGSSLVLSEKCKPRKDPACDSEEEKQYLVWSLEVCNKIWEQSYEFQNRLHGERRRERLKKDHPEVSETGKFHSYSWVEDGYLFSCCFL